MSLSAASPLTGNNGVVVPANSTNPASPVMLFTCDDRVWLAEPRHVRRLSP